MSKKVTAKNLRQGKTLYVGYVFVGSMGLKGEIEARYVLSRPYTHMFSEGFTSLKIKYRLLADLDSGRDIERVDYCHLKDMGIGARYNLHRAFYSRRAAERYVKATISGVLSKHQEALIKRTLEINAMEDKYNQDYFDYYDSAEDLKAEDELWSEQEVV